MAESISALSNVSAPCDGGFRLDFEETTVLDGEFHVYVGPAGDTTDTPALPSVRGRGRRVVVVDGAFSVVLPELALGGPYYMHMVRVRGVGDSATLTSNAFLTIVPAQLRSRVFGLRAKMHPKTDVGPREAAGVEYPQG